MKASRFASRFTAIVAVSAGLFSALPVNAAGVFYGLWWDGSDEQFVQLDPYSGVKTVVQKIPAVKSINVGAGYLFDPDSSRYTFVGREGGNQDYYYVINAPTGDVVSKTILTQNINSMLYSPADRKIYGLTWADSSYSAYDSLGRPVGPKILKGMEYFVSIDVNTGAQTQTAIPGLLGINSNSHFLDTDSGRYVFSGQEAASARYTYVVNVNTGSLIARIPLSISLNNPVYNPALRAVHGLWWADSSYYASYDSLGRPVGVKVLQGTEYFVTVREDSTVTTVELPGVKYISAFNRAFDSDSGRYVFIGLESTSSKFYYVVDAATGAIVSKTPATDNIISFAYARASSTVDSSYGTTGILGAITTSAYKIRSRDGYLTVDVPESPDAARGTFSVALMDLSGRTVLRTDGLRGAHARINARGLRSGVYLYRIRLGEKTAGSGKMMLR